MRVYEMGRRSGKTAITVNWLRNNKDAVMIVTSEGERRRILREFFTEEEAPSYESRIVTAHAYNTFRGRHRIMLAIDNLDLVLYDLFGCQIEFATLTKDT